MRFLQLSLVLYIVLVSLLSPSAFEDNRYNQGVVFRSALVNPPPLLETSLVHWFFEKYEIPRPEDWHRGLSILLQSYWVRLTRTSSDIVARLPHLVWIGLWLGFLYKIYERTRKQENTTARRIMKEYTLLVFLMMVSPWGISVLERAYLDDVPAGAVICLGIYLFIRSEHLTLRATGIFGVLCGLSFFVKNLYVLWGPIGVCVIALLVWKQEAKLNWKTVSHIFVHCGLFTIMFFTAAAPKFVWNVLERGEILETPAQNANRTFFHFSTTLDHFPFFLFDDDSYRTLEQPKHPLLARTWIKPNFWQISGALYLDATVNLFFAFGWIILGALTRFIYKNKIADVLFLMFFVSTVIYSLFFLLGYGPANQTRYWVVPVSIAFVLGLSGSATLFERSKKDAGLVVTSAVLIFITGWLTSAVYFVQIATETNLSRELGTLPQTLNRTTNGEAVMLDTSLGILYWSEHPLSLVVAYDQEDLFYLDTDTAHKLVNEYNIKLAVYPQSMQTQLEQLGFEPIDEYKDYVLFQYVQ